MKIYTKTGDTGETGLFDGTRVLKSDARVDAYGDVDELNAWLGLVRASLPRPHASDDTPIAAAGDVDAMLDQIQRDLFALGAQLADPRHQIAARVEKATFDEHAVTKIEEWIDRLEATLSPLRRFILAGGSMSGAMLHVARTVCRRAERRMVALEGHEHGAVDVQLITYVNRLSDLLFVMARAMNHRAGTPEAEW